MTYSNNLIPPHGGYRNLLAFQSAQIVYDLTIQFCNSFIPFKSRTHDQMVQAARSGCQNIAEGSQASGTSKKTELKLVGVARASLEELLLDYQDFLRQHQLSLWSINDPRTRQIRSLAYSPNRSSPTYSSYTSNPEMFSNCLICLIHQTNYLLDKLLHQLETQFVNEGGFTEKLFHIRSQKRSY
jgi:restriction system protein